MKNVVKNEVNVQNKKKRKHLKTILISIMLFVMLVFTASGILVVFSASEDIENILDGKSLDSRSLTTFIYDKDGKQIDEIYGLENRTDVKYKDLPENLVNAIVAIEDERYFEHSGIDLKRTFGAIFEYLTNSGNSSYGGSTITQQLVKNITNDNETNIGRKIREWYRACVLEARFSKEYIFETYVNTIYFGEGAYGVDVASKIYFDKDLKDLSLAECAVIAASIQSPEVTNPYLSEESKAKLLERKNLVLDKMLELNMITEAQYSLSKEEVINFKKGDTGNKIKSYFVESAIEQVIQDLQKQENITYEEAKKKVYTGGYKIYTTMDPKVQNAIDKAYNNKALFYKDRNGDFMQSAMVVIEHSSGNVVGLIGGASKKNANYILNRATQSYRQPGSCMKPFGAYGPAFEKQKLTPDSRIDDLPITVGSWSPNNFYKSYYGNVSVRQAIAMSMNLPAVRANMKVDKSFAYDFAKGCGLTGLVEDDKAIAPLALGGLTNGVTPLQMASAYATIANGGDYNAPKFYTKVLDKDGKQILFKNYSPKRAMQKSTAAMLTTCLMDVTKYGTAAGYVSAGNMPVAGKTGNTNEDKDQWFCGFTPYYAIACWNGYDTPKTIGYRSYGSYPYTSVKLFNTVINEISKGQEIKQFDTSSAFEEVDICSVSGNLANYGCYTKGFVTKKIVSASEKPKSYCTIHNVVDYKETSDDTDDENIDETIDEDIDTDNDLNTETTITDED